jgi:hypothetical protein
VILPLLVYLGGRILLGDYIRSASDPAPAAPWTFWTDFVAGLGQGTLAHWIVLLGPYITYLLWRMARQSLRA